MLDQNQRIRIAVQKSGRLSEGTLRLLAQAGLTFELKQNKLFNRCLDFPIDLLLVRDDDIPGYVRDGVCDVGIVGLNVVQENIWSQDLGSISGNRSVSVIMPMGFGGCRLSIAVAEDFNYVGHQSLNGLTIATSYPKSLSQFLNRIDVKARIVELGGAVEIAPTLEIADAICDLVSSGATLKSNGLKEVLEIFKSESCLVQGTKILSPIKQKILDRLLQRLRGALGAEKSKYIMMNADRSMVNEILRILPAKDEHTIVPLGSSGTKVAIHAVAKEEVFWETIEQLKLIGANTILVLPIEKMIL